MVTYIFNFEPQKLNYLDLTNAGFDVLAGDDLRRKMDHDGVSQLSNFKLSGHAHWFNTDEKFQAWIKVFEKQTQLEELDVKDCGFDSDMLAKTKNACPDNCTIRH